MSMTDTDMSIFEISALTLYELRKEKDLRSQAEASEYWRNLSDEEKDEFTRRVLK